MILQVLLSHPLIILLYGSVLPPQNQTQCGRLCSPQHRVVVTMRNVLIRIRGREIDVAYSGFTGRSCGDVISGKIG
jgi:hypothetical protein